MCMYVCIHITMRLCKSDPVSVMNSSLKHMHTYIHAYTPTQQCTSQNTHQTDVLPLSFFSFFFFFF